MAIAFGAAVSRQVANSPATSLTYAHATSGSDRFLWVGAFTDDGTGANDVVTGVTYNAVAMTRGSSLGYSTTIRAYIYYLDDPDTGSNNVVISSSGGGRIKAASLSYTGVAGGYDTSTTSSDNSPTPGAPPQDFVTSLTAAANSWTVLIGENNENTLEADTGSTLRTSGVNALEGFDSNGLVSGSTSMTVTVTSGVDVGFWCIRGMGSMKESAGGGATAHNFSLLGVGT